MQSDYTIKMRDGQGRVCVLHINGDCVNEAVEAGASLDAAREDVESNAFGKAIARGKIGADAWKE